MSNFSAEIMAVLNTSGIAGQLKNIEKIPIKLSNITLDTNKISANLQTALNKNKFEIKLDNVNMSGIANQAKTAGTDAGRTFSSSFNSSMSAINTTANNASNTIKHMQQTLASMKFDRSSIDLVTKDLESMNLSISNVTTKIRGNNLNLSIKGIDELGRAVTIIKQFDYSSGNISTVGKTIAQSFDTGAASAKKLAAESKKLAAEAKKAATEMKTLTRSETLSNNISAWMNQNAKAADRFGNELKELQNQLNKNVDSDKYSKISYEFAKIKSKAKAAGLTVNPFMKDIKQTLLQVAGLGSSVMVLQKAVTIFKQMYQQVYDIDTAMTNLYKVTDATSSKYQSFLKQANSSAQELGKTVSSLIEQSATWAKLGYSLDESADLAKLSSVYANVAEISDETAVSDMVTAMKAFNIEAKDAVKIIDPLNELGNKFATSAGDLGNGLSRSASALKLAGSDIYETLAMLTGGAEITQSAGEFGNALKIASMRIRGMKGELEELGEDVDDSVNSISKVQTQILNLTHGKVNIFDDNNDFRNYYQIMKEISDVYDKLTSTEQASLMEILFGKQRGNQGAALIQAFQSGQIEKAYETATNSAGSAMKEQEKWMESLEAKTAQLKAAFQTLSNTTLNSDFIKGAIDSGTTFLNVLTEIIGGIGTLNTLLIGGTIAGSVKSIS